MPDNLIVRVADDFAESIVSKGNPHVFVDHCQTVVYGLSQGAGLRVYFKLASFAFQLSKTLT